ncbi:MAG: MATE family efflux transporter [Qingshengfaniella sp.]
MMSEGRSASVPLTHRRVLAIAGPIVLSNATVPILGVVDTGVVGQMGLAAPIGAVGLGSSIVTAIYWLFGFLRMGTSGMTAQAQGGDDAEEVTALLVRGLIIGLAAGMALILLQPLLFAAALRVAPGSPEVEALARSYMAIRIWSAPAAIAIYAITGWLIALERTRAVLALQVAMNGVNILLDLWFVLGLGWGVHGVGLATFAAEWGGLVLALWFCRDVLRSPAARAWAQIANRKRLIRMAAVNGDILIRTLLLLCVMVSFTFLSADFGDVTLAANQVLLQFVSVTAFALDGFAFAAEALVGQAMGARARASLRRSVVLTGQWGLGIGVLLSLVFAAFGGGIIDLMTVAPDVRIAARDFLPWMVAVPVLGVGAWMLDGVFIGATRTVDMRNMAALSVLVYGLGVVVLVPAFGAHGLWAAFLISYVARGVTLALRYPALERQAG